MQNLSLSQIKSISFDLASLLKAGLSPEQVFFRMQRVDTDRIHLWRKGMENLRQGSSISKELKEIYPDNLISAIEAGEHSGHLPEVFAQIEKASEGMLRLRATLYKVIYPLSIALGSIGILIFFLTQVIPSLTKALPSAEKGIVMLLSDWMIATIDSYGEIIGAAFLVGIALLILWLRDATNREVILSWVYHLPGVGEALSDMYYGAWSAYMSMLYSAGGISVKDSLLISARMLPFFLQDALKRAATEVEKNGLSDTFDPDKISFTDPRHRMPFLILNAFMVSSQTGRLDEQLDKVGPIIFTTGEARLNRYIKTLNIIMTFIAAAILVTPMLSYYLQLGESLANVQM